MDGDGGSVNYEVPKLTSMWWRLSVEGKNFVTSFLEFCERGVGYPCVCSVNKKRVLYFLQSNADGMEKRKKIRCGW